MKSYYLLTGFDVEICKSFIPHPALYETPEEAAAMCALHSRPSVNETVPSIVYGWGEVQVGKFDISENGGRNMTIENCCGQDDLDATLIQEI